VEERGERKIEIPLYMCVCCEGVDPTSKIKLN
jgi:hypothetical protein